MAKTCYNECLWLIRAVDGKLQNSGSYRDGTGYSLRNLLDLNPPGVEIKREDLYDIDNENSKRRKEAFRQFIMRWRVIIYNEFGLAIVHESCSGSIKGKGEGGYYYYLANPELLDEKGKTLREHIEFLAKSETKRDSWITVGQIEKHYKGGFSSMGYLSAGVASTHGYLSKEGTSYRTILGEENLELIQFAMQFGEVLTIKYGKVRAGIDIDAAYSFEPYQVKEIEGRWYVIGNLYPLGHKELAELAIYDLARLRFADEENPDVLYEPVKGFNINEERVIDFALRKQLGQVRTIEITTHSEEFAKYVSEHPLCSAQEMTSDGKFRIYVCLSRDLLVQFGAYGEELSFEVLPKEGEGPGLSVIIQDILLNLYRKTGE
ncbi:MAG: WYL domain-containing protein [Bacteroidales bacterium]|nr:WYL domain-containing protein [Bacteroidales bacterium]